MCRQALPERRTPRRCCTAEIMKGTDKIWKKLLLFVLIVACLFNIINKLVTKASLKQELESSARYIYEQNNK